VKETKQLVKEKVADYLDNIETGIYQKLNYLKPLATVREEEKFKARKMSTETQS
jgi:hypothetical protein